MNDKTAIKPMEEFEREIYGYTLPEVPKHNESVKVGETTGDVETRVRQQTGTAGLNPDILFDRPALHADNKPFTDKKLHSFFKLSGIPKANPNDIADEWFIFGQNLGLAEELTDRFINYDYRDVQVSDEKFEYILRKEQADAVSAAAEYVQKGEPSKQFLWNAKPRFGKTLSTYDLILRLAAKKTLIVTNRPAIANSWYDDFQKFIAWQDDSGKFKFVSSTDALKNKAMTRDEYIDFHLATKNAPGEDRFVAFISLQDLKGAEFAGGRFDKLDWVGGLEWDLLVIDEAHEGVDTLLTDQAFEGITRAFTLHLSGTPFKALADNKFSADQIYNWSYVDEQEARTNWDYAKGENPYENLPELSLFTYQMSKLVEDHIAQGVKIESETNLDYAFDLNEFFKTKDNGKFEHEADVIKFLDKLCTGNLPFSSDQYRSELAHTFWLLPRVASAKALEKLLSDHSYFKDYEVVLAAGDGVARDEAVSDYAKSKRSYDRANKAIKNYDKTITLSVGQLTTGVTIPQWTAIFMLNNIQSPALYFQAAFRVQNPYEYVCDDGTMMRKERAYIFDFAPERTLQLFSDFATGLAGNPDSFPAAEREEQIKNLLNFFPVISEDDKGSMYPLDLSDVLTIPNRIKSAEVISRGFMSNLLFDNIANIFNAPQEVIDLLNQIPPERRGRHQPRKDITRRNPMVDEKGNVAVPGEIVINTTKDLFGAKIYELRSAPDELLNTRSDRLASTIIEELDEGFQKLRPEFSFTVAKITDIKSKAKKNLGYEMAEALDHYQNDLAELKQKEEAALAQASGSEEKSEIRTQVAQEQKALHTTYRADIESRVEKVVQQEVERAHDKVETKKKNDEEGEVRDHLRGFTRTIPAFLMAYGTKDTTLATYEKNIDPDTFEELTGITIEQFQRLRDGFEYPDKQGQPQQFPELFNRAVFDASIKAFFEKKHELADYFDDDLTEDIFDYIPPQQTNQIFTPKWVVQKMVDLLEKENPDIFENPNLKYIDLHTKSGLYPVEIAKRLNCGLADQMPNKDERLKHIFENQVYALAPSNIIYNIVKNFVYAEWDGIKTDNLKEHDLTPDAKDGTAVEKLKELFGEDMKFDVVIGNPPYQEEAIGESSSSASIYQHFMEASYDIAEKVMMITPGRFLFNAGNTPVAWNRKMLADKHLKVLCYEQESGKIFPPPTEIKGGVAVTYRDMGKIFGSIDLFFGHEELRSIHKKVSQKTENTLDDVITGRGVYRLTDAALEDHPEIERIQSVGHSRDVGTSALRILSGIIFFENKPEDDEKYIQVLGLVDRARTYYWVKKQHINNPDNLEKYKVILPKSNGSGAIGEVLSTPLIGEPLIGFTETFIAIGAFDSSVEAEAAMKYVKTKFARALLGILKVTQDNPRDKWAKVPLQDFTPDSDIDWSQSISEIDQQLYRKYGLDEHEIAFIEEKVQAME